MIKRTIYNDLKVHLSMPEITMITGSRQVGKTTLMNLMMNELQKEDRTVSERLVRYGPILENDNLRLGQS